MKSKIIILFLSLVTGIFLFNSCLKDRKGEYWKDEMAGKMYATVANPVLQTLALQPVAGDVNYQFLLNIATDALPTEDITLKLKIDPTAVTKYNTDFKKAYKLFPNLQILNTTIVIKAGTRNAYAQAKVWGAETLDACDNFIAAITIESATTASGAAVTIAGNMKTYLLALPIANPYSGSYHALGVFTHPVNGPRAIDEDKQVNTIDCKTVTCSAGDLGGDASTWLLITVNADYSLTLGGQLSATQPFKPDAGKTNSYNPATKTFTLNYYYEGASGNRVIQENLVRK